MGAEDPSRALPDPGPRPGPGRLPGLRRNPRFSSSPENSVAPSPSPALVPAPSRSWGWSLCPSARLTGGRGAAQPRQPGLDPCHLTAGVLSRDGGELVTLSALSIRGKWPPDGVQRRGDVCKPRASYVGSGVFVGRGV